MSSTIFIVWKDEYSVGNAVFDRDHQQIISIINDLYSAIQKRSAENIMSEVLQRLFEYTKSHFSREEQILMESKFPFFTEHKAVHDKMVIKTGELRRLRLHQEDVANEALALLKNWWLNHIRVMDVQYRPFVGNRTLEGI